MKKNDEYVWENYTKEYENQLKELKKNVKQDFFITEFEDKNGEIEFKDNLHFNWKAIYSIAYKLKPTTIFECGFGAAYHLKNLNTILPNSKLYGCDLLKTQLDFGKKFSKLSKEIIENLMIMDFSREELEFDIKKCDFVFSQAVVMHLSTEKAKRFLRNMGKISSKYICMVEGLKNHENFIELVKECLPNYNIFIV